MTTPISASAEVHKLTTKQVWKRVLLFIPACLIITGIFQLIGFLLTDLSFDIITADKQFSLKENLILYFSTLLGTLLTVYLFRTKIDKESFTSLGLAIRKRVPDIAAGFGVVLFIMGTGFLFLYATGYLEVLSVETTFYSISGSFVLCTMISLSEELMVRGYILNNLLKTTNRYWALLLSSLLFAILHIFNPGIGLLPLINLLLAGILLGAAYIFTKNLWFAISLHLFWNFLQCPIAGFQVSGLHFDALLQIQLSGNPLITGGKFGFEGSILCTALSILVIAAVLYYQAKRAATKQITAATADLAGCN